ncbi:MAG: queuosine precursor transporter [Fibromonadaceae bacterium]|jgi:uncharacterized integral membrane protein (TIGR00697 family)|nr:queuosine precursor transporter [Fibromonadaceae bacterium]
MGSPIFVKLCVLFITVMLASNIIAVKMISIGPLIVPAAIVIFPFTYILSDIFNEIYGYKVTRLTAWYAFGANLLMVGLFKLAIAMPGAPFWGEESQRALESVLGGTWRILAASLTAYMVGDLVNDIIFKKMKDKHGEKKFSLRSFVSSVIGVAIDSFVFITIAFWGTVAFSYTVIASQWCIKMLYMIVLLPATAFATKKIKAAERNRASS